MKSPFSKYCAKFAFSDSPTIAGCGFYKVVIHNSIMRMLQIWDRDFRRMLWFSVPCLLLILLSTQTSCALPFSASAEMRPRLRPAEFSPSQKDRIAELHKEHPSLQSAAWLRIAGARESMQAPVLDKIGLDIIGLDKTGLGKTAPALDESIRRKLAEIGRQTAAFLDAQVILAHSSETSLQLEELRELSKSAKRAELTPEIIFLQWKQSLLKEDTAATLSYRRKLRAAAPLSVWTEAVEMYPGPDDAKFAALSTEDALEELGSMLARKQYSESAKHIARRLSLLNPSREPVYYSFMDLQIRSLLAQQREDEALALLQIVIDDAPQKAAYTSYLTTIRHLWNENKTRRAYQLSNEYSSRFSKEQKTEEYRFRQAKMLEELQEWDRAANIFTELYRQSAANKQKLKYLQSLAWLHLSSRQTELAGDYFSRLADAADGVDRQLWAQANYWHARITEGESGFTHVIERFPASYYAVLARKKVAKESGKKPLPKSCKLDSSAIPDGLLRRIDSLDRAGLSELASRELDWWRLANPQLLDSKQLAILYQKLGSADRLLALAPRLGGTSSCAKARADSFSYPLAHFQLYKKQADQSALDPALLLAVSRTESHFNPAARSAVGAIGLMQLMPETAVLEGIGQNENLYEPEINIRLGSRHLKRLQQVFPDEEHLQIAAYNAGAEAVQSWKDRFGEIAADEFVERIPYQETRNYVKSVLRDREIYKEVLSNAAVSE